MNAQVTVADPSFEVTVADARGRQITLKRPGDYAQYKIIEAVGLESAANAVYLGMVLPLIYVTAIDSAPIRQPRSKSELEELISRLNEDGVHAVMRGVRESFGQSEPDLDEAALKDIATSPARRECLFLMRNGVEADCVFWLDATNRAALCAFYRKHGTVSWNSMDFDEQ